jgi:hypothetical protein
MEKIKKITLEELKEILERRGENYNSCLDDIETFYVLYENNDLIFCPNKVSHKSLIVIIEKAMNGEKITKEEIDELCSFLSLKNIYEMKKIIDSYFKKSLIGDTSYNLNCYIYLFFILIEEKLLDEEYSEILTGL